MKIVRKARREDVYSPWKVVHLKEKIEALQRGELIVPQHIQVDLTGRCNFNCVMCFYRNAGFKHLEFVQSEEIPLDIGVSLFDQMADLGVPALELTGGGEPLLYPAIEKVLDRIAKRDLELALVTNGSLLTKRILDRIVKPKWIRFSIDSATVETHNLIHRVRNQFSEVLGNLQNVVDNNFDDCEVGVSYIVQPSNYREIVKAAELFKSIGVNNIRFSYAYTSKYDKLLSEKERKEINILLSKAKKLETSNFKVFVMETRLDDFAPREKTFAFCGYQMFTFQIGCDSLVYPCCVLKYWKRYAFGDIRKQSLKETALGEQRKRYVEEFDVNNCLPCWLRHKNEFIEYLLVENPAHLNFV